MNQHHHHASGLHHHLPLQQTHLTHQQQQQQQNYHQFVEGVGGGGSNNEESGMNNSGNNVHLVYVNNNNQLPHQQKILSDESGHCSSSGGGSPMPRTSSWVKQQQQQQHPNHHYCNQHQFSTNSEDYGAYSQQQQIRNTFTKEEFQQQHCSYNEYGSSSNSMYYPSQGDQQHQTSSIYYQQQQHDHNSFPRGTNRTDEISGSSSCSYYTGSGCDNSKNYFPEYSSNNSAQDNYHHLHQQHQPINSVQSCSVNEFPSSDRLNYHHNFPVRTAGGNLTSFDPSGTCDYQQQQHHKQLPFRRNSLDSYSNGCNAAASATLESSDLGYNNKYNSSSFSCNQFQHQQQQLMKRGNHGGWPTTNESCNSGADGYLYNSQQFAGNFGQNSASTACRMASTSSSSSIPRPSIYYSSSHRQRQCNSFDDQPSTTSSTTTAAASPGLPILERIGGSGGSLCKAAPVKQRSLSLQYPTSEPTSTINSNFEPHFNIPDINSSSNSLSCSFDRVKSNDEHDVPVPVNSPSLDSRSGPMSNSSSSSNNSGSSNGSDNDNESNNSYPECSTTTAAIINPDSDSNVITLHAGDPNDDDSMPRCEFPSKGDDDGFIKEITEVESTTTTTQMCSTTVNEIVGSEFKLNDNTDDDESENKRSASSIKCEVNPSPGCKVTPPSTVTSTTSSSSIKVNVKKESEKSDLKVEIKNEQSVVQSFSKDLADNLAIFNEILNETCYAEVDASESTCSLNSLQFRQSTTTTTPQKISKRSLSDADKDQLSASTSSIIGYSNSNNGKKDISIPNGWTRETVTPSESQNYVIYVSPSGVKLHTWDELKHYITSDGTCKCGLNCPLRLEHTFSFDPLISNSHHQTSSSDLLLNELFKLDEETNTSLETRFCCNHNKRKYSSSSCIVRIEDSPLISSTRDDLGEIVEHEQQQDESGNDKSKKRRTSSSSSSEKANVKNEKLNATTTIITPELSSSSAATSLNLNRNNVSMPFSQQLPDRTTQTPQRDMSPASSISSEPSTNILCGGGNRSANSTPTPTSSKLSPNTSNSSNEVTPSGKWANQYELWSSQSAGSNLVAISGNSGRSSAKNDSKKSDNNSLPPKISEEMQGPSVGDACIGICRGGRNMTCSEDKKCECRQGFIPVPVKITSQDFSLSKTFCYAPVSIGEKCISDDLCLEENSKCLQAQHEFVAYCGCVTDHQKILDKSSGKLKSVPETALLNNDLATFIGVGVGMTLFCGLTCLVLLIFARARFGRARFGPRRHHYANAHIAPPINISADQGEGGGSNSRHSSQRSSTGGGSRRPSSVAPPPRSGYDSRRASSTSIRSAASGGAGANRSRSNSYHHRPSDPETHLNPHKLHEYHSANVSPNSQHNHNRSPHRGSRSSSTGALAPH